MVPQFSFTALLPETRKLFQFHADRYDRSLFIECIFVGLVHDAQEMSLFRINRVDLDLSQSETRLRPFELNGPT